MKTTAILAITLILSLFTAYANSNKGIEKVAAPVHNATLSGVVLDKLTGETLTGVEVRIEGTNLVTFTDFNGKFVFDGLKPGDYKLSANFISYHAAQTGTIQVDSNELHALNLKLTSLGR